MRSSGVVVVDVSLEDTTEMSLIEHQDMVEHFLAHAPHPSFSKWISIGCLKRRMDDTDLLGLEDRVEGFGQLAVIVMNQATKSLFPLFDSPDVLASLLSHPLTIWMSCDSGKMDTSGADFQKKCNDQRLVGEAQLPGS